MKRVCFIIAAWLAVLGFIAIGSNVDASGCYTGTYNYGRSYGYSYTPSYYYATPYYPIYSASYAPDPDAKLKELTAEVKLQKAEFQRDLTKQQLEFERYKFEAFKGAQVPAQAPAAPTYGKPAPAQLPNIGAPVQPPQTDPMPPADAPKGEQQSRLGAQHSVNACIVCHEQKVAQKDGGGIVGFVGERVAGPDFAIEGSKRVAAGTMPPRSKQALNPQQRGEVTEYLLAPFKASAQAPQVGQAAQK